VYTVNVAGSTTQPNIVAFQDLYSGTAGGTGLCDTQRPTYFTGDTTSSAATFWSYNITAADGVVATSPALSLDGTKVAFVEKGSGTEAHFHVLAWNGGTTTVKGDGVTASDSQDVLIPKSITTGFAASAPSAGSGTVTDLALLPSPGVASDTLSSPFVDYAHDVAYIGNDSGVLFRVVNVFCTTTACTGGGSPAPSLDGGWGSAGALPTGCTGKLTGAVVAGTGNIFVGCSDGKLYGFTPLGAALSGSPLTVGDGTAFGGIVDPPLVDAVNGFVYAVSGSVGGTPHQVVIQASATDLSSPVAATLAGAQSFNIHKPAFNEAYLSGGGTPLLYEETPSSATGLTMYAITFDAITHVMTAGNPGNTQTYNLGAEFEVSPITEFFAGAEDRLFISTQTSPANDIVSFNVTTLPIPASVQSFATEGNGTSGIIVDNASGAAQANSVYFGAATANTAVKLTQSALQ
jgi:hypothetical protein